MLVVPRIFVTVLALGLLSGSASPLWAQAGGLATRVPNDANAVVILNVEKIMASPIAQRENWREQREKSAAAGLTILPASATNFLMAARLDLEFMQPVHVADQPRAAFLPPRAKGGKISS